MKKIFLLLTVLLLVGSSFGQKTQIYNPLSDGGPTVSSPFTGSGEVNPPPTDNTNVAVLPNNGGTSQNSRAPSNYWLAQRTEYLITPTEMTASGFPGGTSITSIGFTVQAAGTGVPNPGSLTIWFKNTTDASYTLGTTWTTAGFTQAYTNAAWAVPISVGTYYITLTVPYTYTGSGIYVAWEYSTTGTAGSYPVTHYCNTNLANGLAGMRGSTLSTTLAYSPYRPETYFGATSLDDYVAVTNIYSLERVPSPFGTPTTINVRVANVWTTPLTFTVTTTVKDVATSTTRFTGTQTVTALAAGTATVLSYTGWSPTLTENVNITAATSVISGETFTANNTKTISAATNNNLYSYNYTTTGAGGYGFTYPGTGIFAAKYTMNGVGQITGAKIVIYNYSANTGNTIKACVLNSSGAIVTESASYTILSGDLGTNKAFTFSTPAVFNNETFYVGLEQTAGTVQWYPLGTFSETPPRGNTFYTCAITGGTLTADAASLKYGIEAQVASYTGPLNPTNFSATPVSNSQINLGWALNANQNNVLLAWSPTGTFGTPINGTTYTAGQTITGGGTVLQYNNATTFNHAGLTANTIYYYKAWSYNGSQYSLGVATNATTFCNATPAPWTQDFELATFPPTCWSSIAGSSTWARSTAASGYGTGTASAFANFYSISGTTPFYLLSLQFTNGTLVNPHLQFDWAYATYAGEVDEMDIIYSTDNGANWYYLYYMPGGSSGELNTGGATTASFVPTSAQWKTKMLGLPAGTNKVGFMATSAYGNNLYLDNVKIVEGPTHDVETISIDAPTANTVVGATVTPKATVYNNGANTETFPVTMTITGGYTSTQTVTALAPGAWVQVIFDNWTPALGQYTVQVCTALSGDVNAGNDCLSGVAGVYSGAWTFGTSGPTSTYLGTGQGWVDHGSKSAPVGYLYVIGGNTLSGLGTECYKYNVNTDTWTAIASLPAGRRVLASAIVGNYIYAIGGSDMSSVMQTSVYKYDILANTWSSVTSLPVAIGWGKAVAYGTNYIYFAGGYDGTNYLSTVYLYDITANTWTAATSMPGGVIGGAFSITGNTLVYVAGGTSTTIGDQVYVGTIDAGTPTTISWATKSLYPGNHIGALRVQVDPAAQAMAPRGTKTPVINSGDLEKVYPGGSMFRFDGAPWGDDGIIVAGGSSSSAWFPAIPNPTYLYKPATDTWIKEPDVEKPVLGAATGSVNLTSGSTHTWKLILAGGIDETGNDTSIVQILTDILNPPVTNKTLNLSSTFLEGLYAGEGSMVKAQDENGDHFLADTADAITVELHNSGSYATIEYTAGAALSTSGASTVSIPADKGDSYYLTIKHRNSIETTSANPVDFSGSVIAYSFNPASQSYGPNESVFIDGTAAIFSADENQDGIVDGSDLSDIGNDATFAVTGYVPSDLTGDGLVDGSDLSLAGNNAAFAVMLNTP